MEFVDTCRVEATIQDLPITEILMNVAMIADQGSKEAPPTPPVPAPLEVPRAFEDPPFSDRRHSS